MKITLTNLKKELESKKNTRRADFLQRYFKCGKGEYAEGDVFIGGIDTPTLGKIIDKYQELTLPDIQKLLTSKYHEERGAALGILKRHFLKAKGEERKTIFKFYLKNTKYINNWDLVDTTAPGIIGVYIYENPKEMKILDKLSKSKDLWERRISVLASFWFIKNGKYDKTLEIVKDHLKDTEDLMHKATGWALREVGKKDEKVLRDFLKKYYQEMPRTALRYSIEKFPEKVRKQYLLGQV